MVMRAETVAAHLEATGQPEMAAHVRFLRRLINEGYVREKQLGQMIISLQDKYESMPGENHRSYRAPSESSD